MNCALPPVARSLLAGLDPMKTGTAGDRNRPDNDGTVREEIWRRFEGDAWAAYDALPPSVRARIQCHAYDAWSVNALVLWRRFRRQTGSSQRAERRLLRHLDACEALEREAFAEAYAQRHGGPLPHLAARATLLRYGAGRSALGRQVPSGQQRA